MTGEAVDAQAPKSGRGEVVGSSMEQEAVAGERGHSDRGHLQIAAAIPAAAPGVVHWPVAPVLEVQDIYKTYGSALWKPLGRSLPVLRGASLTVLPGKVIGLVGENGSGKSTLLKILAGFLKRDRGEITYRGRIGYCPQEPVLYEKLTVDETFALFGSAYRLSGEQMDERREYLLKELRFERYRKSLVRKLSGGTRQKLNLSIALLPEPELLLLDEPYSGFDYETYQRFWSIAAGLVAAGKALLVVSHLLHETHRFDEIHEIVQGRIQRRAAA